MTKRKVINLNLTHSQFDIREEYVTIVSNVLAGEIYSRFSGNICATGD